MYRAITVVNVIDRLLFAVMWSQCVFCEVRTRYLNVIPTNLILTSLCHGSSGANSIPGECMWDFILEGVALGQVFFSSESFGFWGPGVA